MKLYYFNNNRWNIYYFQHFETTGSSGDNMYTGKIGIDEVEIDQWNLLENMVQFNKKTRTGKRR